MARELPPPIPQGLLANVHLLPLLSQCLHYKVDVGMNLIRVQHQGIPVLQRNLFPGEQAAGFEHTGSRRARLHRPHVSI
jgi:hypothetical protein